VAKGDVKFGFVACWKPLVNGGRCRRPHGHRGACLGPSAGRSFTCPVCGMTSHNPNDVREGYCGNCHDWTGA